MRVILLRHGQSLWNLEGKFTGWKDVDLSERGKEEARNAGKKIREKGYNIDIVYTSVLKRAIKTAWLVMEELNQEWLPIVKDWRLNERHYGDLQGKNKKETVKKFGEIVHKWRRSFSVRPPALKKEDPRYLEYLNDRRYNGIRVPLTESLEDVYNRVIPYWNNEIVPKIKSGKVPLVSAHGNSLRALVKYLDNISDKDVESLNIPTGIPLVYEFDKNMSVTNKFYLASKEELNRRVSEVKNQTKV